MLPADGTIAAAKMKRDSAHPAGSSITAYLNLALIRKGSRAALAE
jgi:hypothetical protein